MYCVAQNGHLVSIPNQETISFLTGETAGAHTQEQNERVVKDHSYWQYWYIVAALSVVVCGSGIKCCVFSHSPHEQKFLGGSQ